jgi:hypothetical protein
MSDLPGYLYVAGFFAVSWMAAAICVVLYRGAIRAGLGRPRAAGVAAVAATLLGGWLVATSLLARAGTYDHPGPVPLTVLVAGAVLIASLAATRIPVMSRILAAPGTAARLAVPQTVRILGPLFLVVMVLGHLPAVFAVPAGVGDFATGAAAPFVAWRLTRGRGRREAIWFNAFSIADLVNAITIATLSIFLLGYSSMESLRLLPLSLVPTFAVPLDIALSVVSLGRLLPRRALEPAFQA